jgi:hypothetical protein
MTSAEFVNCKGLPPGAVVDVETKNRHYQIECLGGSAIRISGHPDYCPTPINAELQGSSDQRGIVRPGMIERGRQLQFRLEDSLPITTSKVEGIYVVNPGVSAPPGSQRRLN